MGFPADTNEWDEENAMIHKFLPVLPEGAEPVNSNLAMFRDQGDPETR